MPVNQSTIIFKKVHALSNKIKHMIMSINPFLFIIVSMVGLGACVEMTQVKPQPKPNLSIIPAQPTQPVKPLIQDQPSQTVAVIPKQNSVKKQGIEKKPSVEKIAYYSHQLMGLDGSQLTQIFGPPAFLRREGEAEVWVYRQQGCMGFFYLYANRQASDRTGGMVRWVEMQKADKVLLENNTCLMGAKLAN